MGRDITGLRIDKKTNIVPKSNGINQVIVHAAPRIAAERVEGTDSNAEDHIAKSLDGENGLEKQDVLGVKSTNYDSGLPDSKAPKPESLKPGEKKQISAVKPASGSASTGDLQSSSPAPVSPPFIEKEHSSATHAGNIEASKNGGVKIIDSHFPMSANVSQPASPLESRKPVRPDDNRYHDEEDNISLASSAATSVRSTISRITIPVAPKFVCNDRLSRRREFYSQLEEKHRALEAEKVEVAARTKEEEEAAIKLLRKTAVYKANPVPSFYRDGPPPKVELKKLPVTRAKSPNLSRRKSCSDAVKSSPDEKGNCARIKRHSIGAHKAGSTTPTVHKHKDAMVSRNSGSTTPTAQKTKGAMGSRYSDLRSSKEGISTPISMKSKTSMGKTNITAGNKSKNSPKDVKETSKTRITKGADISDVQEETNTSSMADYVADVSVVEETMTSPTAMEDKISTDTYIPVVEEEGNASDPKAAEQKTTADIAVET